MTLTLSGLQQRWLALGLLAVALIGFWFVVAAPLWDSVRRQEQRVAMLREQAARLQALVDATPRFVAVAREMAANPNVAALAFDGQPSVAVAELQASVSRVFVAAGGTVTSGEAIGDLPGRAAGEIAVRATVEADVAALVRALHAIGSARPLMKVAKLSIREPDAEWAAATPVGPQPNVANRLIVDIVVSAVARRAP